jgi:hypothetical protein
VLKFIPDLQAIFLPIALECESQATSPGGERAECVDFAREVGFVSPGLTQACSTINSDPDGPDFVCKVKVLGAWVDTASFRSACSFPNVLLWR